MAGLGRKVFTAGDVLTASQVQDYLQDQAVMVFAGTAARSSAIATPSEGMVAITTDTDELQYYNGSSWVAGVPFAAWQSWSPTLSLGWLNGNGVWTAKYAQIGKTVIATGYFVVGSSTTKGSGLHVSLPITAANSNNVNAIAWCAVTSTTNFAPLAVIPNNTTTIQLAAINVASTYATLASIAGSPTNAPIAWATGSVLSFTAIYEAA
jgi:hypothetical protein